MQPTDSTPTTDNTALVGALRRAADSLVARRSIRDLEETLAEIVAAAVQTVPGADAGGISLTEDGHVSTRAPTTDTIGVLDELQAKLDEGPCMSAMAAPHDHEVVHAADLSAAPDSDRWPNFAPQATAHGYRSLLSTPLSVTGERFRATLNLYAHEPDSFDSSSRILAGLFGAQAALLLYGARHVSNLEKALETRDVIGRAKGILMERFDVDDDRAFQMLVRSSQDTNMKLVDVAGWLTSPNGRRASKRSATMP